MNLVAIVGRPNVGKSTLFNRIIQEHHAIVEAIAGVTRDRIYGKTDWNGKSFQLIDTGGFIPGSEDTIEKAIREQAFIAIEEADVVLFVCDGRDGVTPFDEDIAIILRSSSKPVVLAINKCDNPMQDNYSYEFHKLGLGDPYPVSSLSGRNSGDLLDAVTENFKLIDKDQEDTRLKIAFVGRPNVGKSSLTNALLGENRSIVTNIPGTTRDAVDSVLKYYGEEIVLIDTAGLRRKSQVKENLEMFSIMRTARAIERCDVAVIVTDGSEGLLDQDKKIINQVDEARKGILIAVNKWDLVEKDSKTADTNTKEMYNELQSYQYAPILYISALTKQRISKVIDLSKDILEQRKTRISTGQLNSIILPILEKTPPPSIKGKDLRINYITQVRTEPPVFAFFANHPEIIPDNYKRFIERVLRENFEFRGTPISFIFKRKNPKRDE
jgi:GTP-binding protein